uniref:RDD domain-containing protein n=1 Tax=Ditylenchus dipsaci TaxID=166011 RepID=A0A915E4S4_9BILA
MSASEENNSENISALSNNNEPKDYGSAKAYAEEVQKWYTNTQLWMACQQMNAFQQISMQMSQQYAMISSNMQQAQQARPQMLRRVIFGNINVNLPRIFGAAAAAGRPMTIIAQHHTIPSFFRRIAAETIDAFILFIFKLFVVYMLVETEIMDLDQFDKILSTEADFQTLIDVTQGLFNIEVLCKLASAILEAICITYGFMRYPPGCTPGKFFMRIKVISCLDIQPVQGTQDRVLVTSLPSVTLQSSLIRSLLKNVMTVFLFPLSTAFYIFNYNRAIYDLAAKTIVVNM